MGLGMGISVENFMASQIESGRQSKLEPFKDDILLLKKNGFSQKQIQQFLAQNGVQAGLTTINWFIRSRLQKVDSPAEKTGNKYHNTNQLTNQYIPVSDADKQVANSVSTKQKPSEKKKFNWQQPINPDEIY